MRSGLVVTGVLGAGTAVVFALAALTASLFPSGTVVSSGMNGVMIDRGWAGGGVAIPVPAPIVLGPGEGDGGLVAPNQVRTLPGDIVVTDPAPDVDFAPEP